MPRLTEAASPASASTPGRGAVMARLTPSMRLTAMSVEAGFSAKLTSNPGPKGYSSRAASLVVASASISIRPKWL